MATNDLETKTAQLQTALDAGKINQKQYDAWRSYFQKQYSSSTATQWAEWQRARVARLNEKRASADTSSANNWNIQKNNISWQWQAQTSRVKGVNIANPNSQGQPDFNLDTQNRQDEIVSNLTAYKASNPELFRNRGTFDSMFHYWERDAVQKKTLDDYFNQVARERVARQTMAGWDLSSLSSTDLEILQESNPDAYNKYMNDINNKAVIDSMIWGKDIMESYTDAVTAQLDAYFDSKGWETSKEVYDKFMDTDAIREKKDDLADRVESLEKLDQQMSDMETDIRKQLWDWASEWYIRARTAKANKELQNERDWLVAEANRVQSGLTADIEAAQTNYSLYLKDKQTQDAKDEKMLQAKLGITKEAFDKSWSLFERDLDKQDRIETQQMSLLEKMDISKATESQIDSLDTADWIKDYLKFKKNMPEWFEVAQTLEYDGNVYWLDKYGNHQLILWNENWEWFQLEMDLVRNNPNNAGKDTNNPWNITADWFKSADGKITYWGNIGAIGTYTSPNWREYYVFDTEEDWARALRDFTKRMVSWNSSSYDPNMNMTDFVRKYTGSSNSNYLSVIQEYTWATWDTLLKNVDPNKLANGLAKADSNMDITNLWYSEKPTGRSNKALKSDAIWAVKSLIDFTDLAVDSKKPLRARIEELVDNGRLDLAQWLINNIVREWLPTPVKNDIAEAEQMTTVMAWFETTFNALKEKLGDDFTDYLEGNVEAIRQKFWESWIDRDVAVLWQQLADYLDVFARKRTWAVIWEQEARDYRKLLPTLRKNPDLSLINIEWLARNAEMNSKTFLNDKVRQQLWADDVYEFFYWEEQQNEENPINNYIDDIMWDSIDWIINNSYRGPLKSYWD